MRKALMSHIPTLAPDEAHYPEALHADIRREAERLSMLENPTPENTKRLAQLLEAARRCRSVRRTRVRLQRDFTV